MTRNKLRTNFEEWETLKDFKQNNYGRHIWNPYGSLEAKLETKGGTFAMLLSQYVCVFYKAAMQKHNSLYAELTQC